MLHDDNGMSIGYQSVKRLQKTIYIVKMKSCGWLVKDKHNLTLRAVLREERRQLHTLALTSRQRRRGLPQADITQTYILQGL